MSHSPPEINTSKKTIRLAEGQLVYHQQPAQLKEHWVTSNCCSSSWLYLSHPWEKTIMKYGNTRSNLWKI